MRVLALVPGRIDDQILFLPTLHHIKAAFPKAEITVVCDPAAKEAYRLSPLVQEAVPYNFQTRNSPADWANLLGIMRDREFEAVITATRSWSTGLMLWLSGIPTRVGYAGGSNDLFLTHTVPLKSEQSVADQYHDLLNGLQIATPRPDFMLQLPQADLTWAEAARQSVALGEQGYVLVYPGPAISDASTSDIYPQASWLAILQDFKNRQPDMPLALLATSESQSMVTNLVQAMPALKVLTPENVGQVAALIAGANLLVTPDSYPLYLAMVLQVFAVGLFGSRTPDRQSLLQGEEMRVLGIASSTSKVADITPDTVLKKIWNEG